MAELFVSKVVIKLSELVTQELKLLHGVRDEMRWLESELRWIKSFLKDADAKGKRDENLKNWVNDVIQVAYQAEDTIDTFLIKVHHSKGAISCIKRLKARHDVGKEIGKIKDRLNEIKARIAVYGIQCSGEDGDALSLMPVRRRHFLSQPDDADIVGRFNDEKILLDRLLMNHHGQQQQQGSCVISIVGLGGIGKTTLARKLYHSNDVINHFQIRTWLTVSQENSVKGLLKMMLVKVGGVGNNNLDYLEEHELIDMINDSLRTQKALIVLDDIWSEDVCIQMQGIFRNVKNGGRVLITTRFLNVAKRADPSSIPHQLLLLNEDESKKLLLKKAFHCEDAETNCCSELLDIGLRLVRKCGGLPLALVVLGGFLSMRDKTPVEWRKVLETMHWGAQRISTCQEILVLSYEDLPHHMKLCFLYFSAYPEDYEVDGNELIRKWVAEGFIPQEGKMIMEDTGEAILEELIQRSMIHVNIRKNNGSVKTCGIHDLLLDLARSIARKDGFLTVCSIKYGQPISLPLSHRGAVHLYRTLTDENDIVTDEMDARHELRTLMVFTPSESSLYIFQVQIVSAMFRFQFLRVLDLIRAGSLKILPKEIKLMIHLRYLRLFDVNDSGLASTISTIGNLQFLQTIEIKCGTKAPNTLWKIKTLRHVLLRWCTPPQSVKLEDLLTLDSVTFGSHETINWSFPNLRKFKVWIGKEHHGAMLTQLLNELRHLISLHITAYGGCHIEIKTTKDFPFHNTLQSLTLHGSWPMFDTISEFPINLTKLELERTELKEDPMPKLERLQYLVTLKLLGNVYHGKTIVCSAGRFPRLECLLITCWLQSKQGEGLRGSIRNSMPNLEEWRIEKGAMPKLTFLRFTSCEKLKMLPDLQHVMSLQKLELYGMSQELMRRSRREDLHKIQHVPKLSRFTGTWPHYNMGTGEDMDEGEFSDAREDISEEDDLEVRTESKAESEDDEDIGAESSDHDED